MKKIKNALVIVAWNLQLLKSIKPVYLYISFVTSALGALLVPAILFMWKQFQPAKTQSFAGWVMIAVAGLLVQQTLATLSSTYSALLGEEAAVVVNGRILEKIAQVPYYFLENNEFQSEYGLVIREASYRTSHVPQELINFAGSSIVFIGLMVFIFSVITPLAILFFIGAVIMFWVEGKFGANTINLRTTVAPGLLRMQFLSQLSIDASWQRDLRVYRSNVLLEEFKRLGNDYLQNLRKFLFRYQFLRLLAGATSILFIGFGFLTLLNQVVSGAISPQNLVIIVPAILIGVVQGRGLAFSLRSIVEIIGYASRLKSFLEMTLAVSTESSDILAQQKPKLIHLQNVSYRYASSDKLALDKISTTLVPGVTAIVGPNGAGKTTLVKILAGLLEPTEGAVLVEFDNGQMVPLKTLPKAVMFQDPSHFCLSARQNVTMRSWQEDSDDDLIQKSLEMAGIWGKISGLPDQMDAILGSGFGGFTDLSGGQWQRLALARLIFNQSPFMILDEPIASLDPAGEKSVFSLVNDLEGDRFIVFTTHRYDTIRESDQILVIVDSVLTEIGTHSELLNSQNAYWSLYIAQTGRLTEEHEA